MTHPRRELQVPREDDAYQSSQGAPGPMPEGPDPVHCAAPGFAALWVEAVDNRVSACLHLGAFVTRPLGAVKDSSIISIAGYLKKKIILGCLTGPGRLRCCDEPSLGSVSLEGFGLSPSTVHHGLCEPPVARLEGENRWGSVVGPAPSDISSNPLSGGEGHTLGNSGPGHPAAGGPAGAGVRPEELQGSLPTPGIL